MESSPDLCRARSADHVYLVVQYLALAGVARAAGWPCRDPLDLQRRYALALDRRLRHRRVLVISAQLLAPLILAVPVWIIVKAIMGTLILVMNAQEVHS